MMPERYSVRNLLTIGGMVVFSVLACLWVLYLYMHPGKVTRDAPLQKAFDLVPSIEVYSQNVTTRAYFPDRVLTIEGIYEVNNTKRNYSSYSTTTLSITGDPVGHTFTHKNIALGDDVYLKVETNDTLLKKSIQSFPEWRHFTALTIPKPLAGIAIAGAIQDNLSILGSNGQWLKLTKKWGSQPLHNTPLLRYTFRLSGETPTESGALAGLISRIGTGGIIDIWIDPKTSHPQVMRFMNDSYVSTTTLLYDAAPLPFEVPSDKKS